MNLLFVCGVCGSAKPPSNGISEVLKVVDVASGVSYFRCRRDMAVPITEREVLEG